jgi:hypothetical protein
MQLLALCVCASGVVSVFNSHRVDVRDVIVLGRRKDPPWASPTGDQRPGA